jgi:hypothetical protein
MLRGVCLLAIIVTTRNNNNLQDTFWLFQL